RADARYVWRLQARVLWSKNSGKYSCCKSGIRMADGNGGIQWVQHQQWAEEKVVVPARKLFIHHLHRRLMGQRNDPPVTKQVRHVGHFRRVGEDNEGLAIPLLLRSQAPANISYDFFEASDFPLDVAAQVDCQLHRASFSRRSAFSPR